MSESTTIDAQPTARIYWPKDYARFADALRRSRKGKTPDQIVKADAVATVIASLFANDFEGFDAEKFLRSAKLRIETVHYDEFLAWATKRGYDTAAPAQYHTEFYNTRYEPGAVEDVYLDDDEDDEDEDEPGEGGLNL